MKNAQAVFSIIEEALSKRSRSKAALGRIREACSILGLSEDDTREVEIRLEYRSQETGKLYPPNEEQEVSPPRKVCGCTFPGTGNRIICLLPVGHEGNHERAGTVWANREKK